MERRVGNIAANPFAPPAPRQRPIVPAKSESQPKGSGVYAVAPNTTVRPVSSPFPPRQTCGGGPGVVIVSENADIVANLKRLLATYDADVISVGTSGEAIYELESMSAAAPFRARLVLLDMLLSGLRGPQLLDLLRRMPHVAKARFVLLSSLSATTAERMMTEVGADGILPLNLGMLHTETAISGWLGYRDSAPL